MFSDYINPIVVREMRQLVRSKFVIGAMMTLLTILLIGSAAFIITTVLSSLKHALNLTAGRSLFMILLGILAYVALIFVPAYTGIRLAAERKGDRISLLYITTISPAAIIRGKMMAAAAMTILLVSLCMPFMVFTYLLRGIDIPSMFLVLVMLLIEVLAVTQLAVLLACLPVSRGFRILLALFMGMSMFSAPGMFVAMSTGLLLFGAGSSMRGWSFWGGTLTGLAISALGIGLMFVMSVAMISPPTSNRSMPVRRYLTGAWLLSGILAGLWQWLEPSSDAVIIWMFTMTGFLVFLLALFAGENTSYSFRIRRGIPANRIKRILVFPFFTGAVNGILWALLLLMVSIGTGYFFDWKMAQVASTIALYTLAYTMTARLLLHLPLLRRIRPAYTIVVAMLLMAAVMLLPALLAFFLNRLADYDFQDWYFGNLFALDSRHIDNQLMISAAWALAALLLNVPDLLRQGRAFTRAVQPDELPPPPDAPAPPPLPE